MHQSKESVLVEVCFIKSYETETQTKMVDMKGKKTQGSIKYLRHKMPLNNINELLLRRVTDGANLNRTKKKDYTDVY